jgi:hypothetical protein
MSAPMSDEDRQYMQQMTGAAPARPTPTHEAQVRTLLGWITLFTGIVAAATVANFIASVVIGLQAARPF